ncbi:bifunctional oligoribonuclease/PAP phosphatase NrnA, partial [Elusimicrobiota bacterium]
ALNMAAELIKAGVKTQYMSDNLYANNKLSSLLLLSVVLSTLTISSDGKIATMKLTNKMYADTGANTGDSEGIINYAMTIPKVTMSIMFSETKDNTLTKVSMRSRGNNDVSSIAKHFGGGGHKNAAGFSMQGTIENSQKDLLNFFEKSK